MNFGVGIYGTYVEIMEGSVDCWWNLDRILSLRSVVEFSWYLFITNEKFSQIYQYLEMYL